MAANSEDFSGIEAETSFEVNLYIYDLSKELSKSFKKILKGKPLPGIWHTGLVAYGREYYFASSGVESCRPGETILGEPDQILTLGKTELPYSVFLEYVFALGESAYKPGTYNLLEHNCNSFSQEVSNFLTGGPIPDELRELPSEILSNKTLSNTLREYFHKLNFRVEGSKGISFGVIGAQNGHSSRKSSIDQIPPESQNGQILVNGQTSSTKNLHKNSKSSSKLTNGTNHNSVDQSPKKSSKMPVVNGETPKETIANDTRPAEVAPKKDQQLIETVPAKGSLPSTPADHELTQPPVASPMSLDGEAGTQRSGNGAFSANQDPATAEEASTRTPSSRTSIDDDTETPLPTFTSRRSKKYPDPPILYPDVDGEGSYKKLLELVGERLSFEEKNAMNEILEYLICPEGGAWALGAPHLDAIGRILMDRNLPDQAPVLMLEVMAAAALKEDVILLLHQDREHHHIMSYLYRVENLPEAEQEQIATYMCNLCSNTSSFDWLMYISEWLEEGHSCNNSRVSVRVAVHSLLCDRPSLQDKGSALIYNLALKELFDDTATELAMALMQFLQSDLSEELAFRGLTSLLRFMCISYNDVPALMKMMGPDVRKFNKKSERVDDLVDQIQIKLSVSISA